MRVSSRTLFVLALALVLSGCGSNWFKRKEPLPCPAGSIVKDASRKVAYRDGPGRDITDVLFEASLPRVLLSCSYDDRGVEVTTVLTIVAARGPANTTRRADVTYFAAIIDPDGKIVAKSEFQSVLQFPVNIDRGSTSEELVQRIPLRKDVPADDYTIALGFQLNREELEANRRPNPVSLISPAGVKPTIPAPAPSAPAGPGQDFPKSREQERKF